MHILGLMGTRGAGKDTVYKSLYATGVPVVRFAFADELKEQCHKLFGVPREILWGTQEQKDNTLTKVLWKNIPKSAAEAFFQDRDVDRSDSSDPLTVRELTQLWGTEICRKFDGDCWINVLRAAYPPEKMLSEQKGSIVIVTDVRFDNESACIQTDYTDGIVCGLTRGEVSDGHKSEDVPFHLTDHMLDNRELSFWEQRDFFIDLFKKQGWIP